MRIVASALVTALLALPGAPRAANVVVVEGDRVVVKQHVSFATNTAVLGAGSAAALDQIAAALRAAPDIERVVVEGHTDSVGNADANRALSLARANAVVAALVARGVQAERLSARGMGDTVPLASNDTEAGRERNRRVEFSIVARAGKVTAAAEPLAKLASVVNDVDAKAPDEPTWLDGRVGQPLFRAWRVNTKPVSAADVAFKDTSRVHLRENTLIVIFGDNTFEKREQRRASLENGALVTRIDELLGGQPLFVESAAGTFDVGRGRAVVDAVGDVSRVSNHAGDALTVRGRTGKAKRDDEPSVSVRDGYGTRVVRGQPPEPPRPLPTAPIIEETMPTDAQWVDGRSIVQQRWQAVASSETIVEIRGASTDDVVFQARVPSGISSVQAQGLSPGQYRLQLSSVDAIGLESPATEVAFVVTPEAANAGAAPEPVAVAPASSPSTSTPVVDEAPGWCESPLCPVALGAGVVAVVVAGVVTMIVVGESQ